MSTQYGRWLMIGTLLSALGGGACRSEALNQTSEPKPSPSASSEPAGDFAPTPYPRARWRLAPLSELDDVVFYVSQVLIRHEEVEDTRASFQLAGWELDMPEAKRSRRQALELAELVVTEAREKGNFAELARRYSDDSSTKDNGGSMDGITATHLWPWPGVLDALATLKPGEVSRVVETQYGFHVFQLKAVPAEATVSGVHVVISHKQAPGLDAVARHKLPSRSRQEALAIAAEVYELARAKPEDFAKLADKYSDHRDAATGGDFGTWSTHEPSGLYREVDLLSRLAVGEVAPPLDTPYGVQVFMRTPNQPRKEYAMVKVQLRFDPELSDAEIGSKAAASASASKFAKLFRLEPAKFDALRKEICCDQPLRIIAGRESPELEAALDRLHPGQISAEPVADPIEYLIPKRVELDVLPKPPATRFELPSPSEPDLRYILSRAPALGSELKVAANKAATELGLSTETAAALIAGQTVPADFADQTITRDLQVLDKLEKDLATLLDAEKLARYRALRARHFERLILHGDANID